MEIRYTDRVIPDKEKDLPWYDRNPVYVVHPIIPINGNEYIIYAININKFDWSVPEYWGKEAKIYKSYLNITSSNKHRIIIKYCSGVLIDIEEIMTLYPDTIQKRTDIHTNNEYTINSILKYKLFDEWYTEDERKIFICKT